MGDVWIGLLVLVEAVVPPTPSVAILPFGYLTRKGSLSLVGLIVRSAVGAWLGGLDYHAAGRALRMERSVQMVAAGSATSSVADGPPPARVDPHQGRHETPWHRPLE